MKLFNASKVATQLMNEALGHLALAEKLQMAACALAPQSQTPKKVVRKKKGKKKGKGKGKHHVSKAGRARIAAAQKKRWAKLKLRKGKKQGKQEKQGKQKKGQVS